MKNFPDWRFDFSDEWQEKILGNYIKNSNLKNSSSIYEAYSVNNKIGLVKQEDLFEDSRYATLDKSSNKIVRPNEFAYNPARINVGSIGYNNLEKTVALSPLYVVFSTDKKNIDDNFLWQYFKTENFSKELKLNLEGSVRQCLPFENLSNIKIKLPSLDEQKKIAEYLSHLDKSISAQEKKLNSWREMKKGLLQKIFSQDFRFADDNGNFYPDWQEKKLGEVAEILSAARVHRAEWKEQGIPFYRSSDVVSAFHKKENSNGKVYISEELYKKLTEQTGILEKNDILITGGGSIGIPFLKNDNSPLYTKDADLIWIKHGENFESKFLYQFFLSENFRGYLKKISHLGTISHYTIIQVKNTPIKLPCIEEQKKIAEYFTHLDKIISSEQKILENLRQMKKGLLQKLFV